jgi:hypothetical protein
MPQIVAAAIAQSAVAAPVVAPVVAGAGTGLAAAGTTTAIELAKQKAIETSMQQMATQGAKQATAEAVKQQVGTEVAKQGIAQAGQQTGVEAMKQGIFSNPAGVPPTAGAPVTPAGPAQPLPPAGPSAGTPFTPPNTPPPPAGPEMTLEQQLASLPRYDPSKFTQYELVASGPGGQTPLVEKAATTLDPAAKSLAPFKSNVPVRENMLAYKEALPNFQTAQNAKLQAQISNLDGGLGPDFLKTVPTPEKNALKDGIQAGLDFMNKNPVPTGLGLMSAGEYLNQPEEEDEDKYKNKVDMSGFQASTPTQRPFTRSYEYQKYAVGGPVEQMAAMNSVGMNTGYPMANVNTPVYSNPMMQRPEATNVIAPSADAGVGMYSGEKRFAEGGLSAAERREYGLKTRSQRAAQNLTKTFEEMEEERQKEAMKLFGDRSDPGIVPRSRTQMLSSPFSAAMAEHARLGKKAKVPVVEMPKTNLGDIDNYMDIPIDAANGGIMRGAERYARGGPAFMGPVGSGHYGAGSYSKNAKLPSKAATPTAPVMSAPQYSAPAQQTPYTPISYQGDPSYQMPAQQSNMDDFYNYMNQQLGNYGYAEGGGIMGGSHLGGYSDGGRLLKGPGDGVSDSIPAVIGKRQPARLADGEFVIPARIVSELGNGSTEAGARKLYAMMERVQATRKKSIGKKKVAVNSKADKHLPA